MDFNNEAPTVSGLNPNIALQAGKGVAGINPLAVAQQFGNVANTLNQNTAFQSKLAAGRDFQSSIGPDGQMNMQKFGTTLANDPQAAYAAQAAHQAAQTNFLTHLQNNGLTLDQAIKRNMWFANSLGGVLAKANPNNKNAQPVTQKDIIGMAGQAVAEGVMSAKEAAKELAGMPKDPQQLQAWAQQKWGQAMGTVQQAQILFPQPENVNMGNKVGVIDKNAVTNPGIIGTQATMGLPPSAKIAPVTVPGPNGAHTVMPAAAFGAGAAPLNGGITPGQNGNALAPGQPAPKSIAPPAQPAPSYQSYTSTPPAQIAAQTSVAKNAASMGNEILNAPTGSNAALATLQQMNSEINGAHTGNMSQMYETLSNAAQSMGINLGGTATNIQMLRKDTAMLVAQSVKGLGQPTDGKMMTIFEGTPNEKMTPEAMRGASGLVAGSLQYRQALAEAYASFQHTNGPTSAPQFMNMIRKNTSMSVWQFANLPPAFRNKYYNSLTAKEKLKFVNDANWAVSHGMIDKGALLGQ